MKLKHVRKAPSIRYMSVLLAAMLVFSLVSVLFIVLGSANFGILGSNEIAGDVMYFEELAFQRGKLCLEFPQGGYLVPIHRQDLIVGAAVFGNGTYIVEDEDDRGGPLRSVYLALNDSSYFHLVNNLFLSKKDEQVYQEQALVLSKMAEPYETWIRPMLTRRFIPMSDRHFVALLFPTSKTTENVVYKHLNTINLHQPRKDTVDLGSSPDTPKYPEVWQLAFIAFGYICLGGVLFTCTVLLTSDFTKRSEHTYRPPFGSPVYLILIALAVCEAVIYIMQLPVEYIIFCRLTFLCILSYLSYKNKTPLSGLRINASRLFLKLLPALFIGILMAAMGTLRLPEELSQAMISELSLVSVLHTLFTCTWFCLIAYGYVMYILESRLDTEKALAVVCTLSAVFLIITGCLAPETNMAGILLNALILVPITILITGKVVVNTQSVFIGGIMLTVASILPKLFIY